MLYRFDEFELDRSRAELRRQGEAVAVEPQVFALLLLLAENSERLVSRDEIIEKVWDGRIVSDSAVDSRVKSARRALGDDGRTQRFIRTIHGRGFRFVAEMREAAAAPAVAAPLEAPPPAQEAGRTKPSIAVLPFRLVAADAAHVGLADALPDELIAELSRLRWLFVIARGSSFRFRSAAPDAVEVGKVLGVRYCLSGMVDAAGSTLTVTVQLVDTSDGGVVWADRFVSGIADIHATRALILARVVAALEVQIPLNEANAARHLASENLDAWSAYHLGLQHMFRFNRGDNAEAGRLFAAAADKDAGFARAHAGLSFVHFQNAFLRYTPDNDAEVIAARRAAERSVELDPLDPFANFTMGRSHWLEGDLEASQAWLERATAISPNYAQGIYARALIHALCGRGAEGRSDADLAMALSPLDPLYYAMSATRALSHIVRGEEAEGASWAEKAARSPNAHVLIALIAAVAHHLNGDCGSSAAWAARVKARGPALTRNDFFRSFPFVDGATRGRFSNSLVTIGF
ncbi:MAG: winged helix-turn-helix domain-containing protein [Candidatus Binatia bacterium]